MLENKVRSLVDHRFIMHRESREGFNRLRSAFSEAQKIYPYLSGFGLFGSRTKGTEHFKSDYDISFFCNLERMSLLQLDNREEWWNIRRTLEQKLGGRIDNGIVSPSSGMQIDISKKSTDKQIKMFIKAASNIVDQDVDESTMVRSAGLASQDIYSRFLLTVGDEVYENRQYILDTLKAVPNGDGYFRILMRFLDWHERGDLMKVQTPRYGGYPQSIAEAEEYFLTTAR